MIQLDNTSTAGFQNAFRGMRYPQQSNHLSDSEADSIGEKDLKLGVHLAKCGDDHGKMLRQIMVWVDITAPLYWWKEMDQYKVGTVTNSESTMHKLMENKFTKDDFSCEYLPQKTIDLLLDTLNLLRDFYISYNEEGDKNLAYEYWYECVQSLPSGYNQKRLWTANYQVLRHIYHARKNHKLKEWKAFCKWCESLPYSELITSEAK